MKFNLNNNELSLSHMFKFYFLYHGFYLTIEIKTGTLNILHLERQGKITKNDKIKATYMHSAIATKQVNDDFLLILGYRENFYLDHDTKVGLLQRI